MIRIEQHQQRTSTDSRYIKEDVQSLSVSVRDVCLHLACRLSAITQRMFDGSGKLHMLFAQRQTSAPRSNHRGPARHVPGRFSSAPPSPAQRPASRSGKPLRGAVREARHKAAVCSACDSVTAPDRTVGHE